MTSPPRPPFPPSGPPSGLNFSRWTEAQPWPPLPAATCSSTRSTKVVMGQCLQEVRVCLGVNKRKADPPSRPGSEVRLTQAFGAESADSGDRNDVHDLAAAVGA